MTTTTVAATPAAFDSDSAASLEWSDAFAPYEEDDDDDYGASTAAAAAAAYDDANSDRDVYAMDAWAASYGVQKAGGIEYYQTESATTGADWGVYASTSVPAGSPILFVPEGLVLSSSKVTEEFGGSYGGGLTDAMEQMRIGGMEDQMPLFALFVKVLAEYERGEESAYWEWLNSLPRRYYNGASMTYDCYELLPPHASRLAREERVRLNNFRNALRYVSQLTDATKRDKGLARWAYSVAVTRSFEVEEGGVVERRIVPVADMFNHGAEAEVRITYDDSGNCIAATEYDIPPNTPLRISYGDPTNPTPFLAAYGFLDDTSPACFCKLMDVQEEMGYLGLETSDMIFYRDTGEIAAAVWDVLLCRVLSSSSSDDNKNARWEFANACRNGDDETKAAYHERYFPYTYRMLREHVDGTLEQLEGLSAKAAKLGWEDHPRVPLILSHNDFVRGAFENVRSNLDSMAE